MEVTREEGLSGNAGASTAVVTRSLASTGEKLWGEGVLGSMRGADRRDRSCLWCSLGGWCGHFLVVSLLVCTVRERERRARV
jgi:hypothetical protein